jgi:Fur family ferric uptake transcriptional regulator
MRMTRQREAIWTAIEQAGRPLSVPEVHGFASVVLANLGLATVYRTIAWLQEAGRIVPVEMPGEAPRYEPAGLAHHHHFHCRTCGRVFDLPGCTGNIERLVPRGFRLEAHELVLSGRCQACA